MAEVQPNPSAGISLRREEIPAALQALQRGEAMGFTTDEQVDLPQRILGLLEKVQAHQIATQHVLSLRDALGNPTTDRGTVLQDLKGLYAALGENPVPQQEMRSLLRTFDAEQLASLLVISPSSVQRYARGERHIPEPVVDRVHWLALVVGHLTGTYNEYGVRRWFRRPRQALDGTTPEQALLAEGGWSHYSEGARKVEGLAKSLIGMPAT